MNPTTYGRLMSLRIQNQDHAATHAPRFEKLRTRHLDGTAPQAISAWQLFQTPQAIAQRLADALRITRGARVLEPSAGLGRLLDAIAQHHPAEVVAVDVSPDCCGALFRQDRRAVKILQRDFLTLTTADLGTFDAIAMNPPFHMRADIQHIRHALQFLRPRGTLAAICMDTTHRAADLRPIATTWEPLGPGAFAAEGTNTPTVLLTITK